MSNQRVLLDFILTLQFCLSSENKEFQERERVFYHKSGYSACSLINSIYKPLLLNWGEIVYDSGKR